MPARVGIREAAVEETDMPRESSLVLYKNRAARVERSGDKLEIELAGGERRRVRPKDVVLLHPGPVHSLSELQPPDGEVATAWELLRGSTTHLEELAELAYGAYTPAAAWAAWQLVEDGLYFQGTPEAILVRSPEEVASIRAAREAEAARQRAWQAFLGRVRAGRIAPEDDAFLRDVEMLALEQRERSRVLQELGRGETPENAHALLLELGYWDYQVDPYPARMGLPAAAPGLALPELPGEARVDLTHLPAFAIDDVGNREPDDALSLEGGRLWVHVADAAALAPSGSPADLEARARGATLYLPEGPAPMLPVEAIHRLGLGLNDVSPALSFGLDLDPAGEVRGVEVVPSWVRVTRLTYDYVETRLDEEPFHSLHRLAQQHAARRRARGAIAIDLPEVKIDVEEGRVAIRPLPPLRSRDLVLEAMLMAGEAAGRLAVEQGIPFPFTGQAPPDTDERPEDMAGMYALRRTLKPGHYQTAPAPHAGLGMEVYAQVTSPLRRYLDLVAHQQLRAYLRGDGLLDGNQVLERVGAAAAVSGTLRRAERLARRHWTLVYLLQNPGWQGEAVLVELRDRRGILLIPELDLEAPAHLRQDAPLNSRLPVRIGGVDLPELNVALHVAG
jgi:exoribonuclease-2